MIYVRRINIIRLSFDSKRLSEIAYGNKRFRKYWKLSNTVLDENKLYDSFLERFDEFFDRLEFYFNFTDMLFLNYCLQSLKNEFCITNVLAHLFFCHRYVINGC